jgi:hypothetical protein
MISTHVEGPQNALNGRLEEPGVSWIQAPKSVVVHHHAAKIAVLSHRARLWPDGLSGHLIQRFGGGGGGGSAGVLARQGVRHSAASHPSMM